MKQERKTIMMIKINLQMFGGRGGASGIGGGGRSISASKLGSMSRDERREALDKAPVGTTVSGLISKRTGQEVHVEKVREYNRIYGGTGAGTSVARTEWQVEGYADPYFARTLRTAADGTNKYYKMRKRK